MPYPSRAMETTTSTGTSNITLGGAVTGYQTIYAALQNTLNIFFDYVIEAVNASGVPTGDYEQGQGYLSASSTLVRSKVDVSSNSNALVNFTTGTKRVYIVLPGDEIQSKGHLYAALVGGALP